MSPERSSINTGGRQRRAIASIVLLAASLPSVTTAFSPINNNSHRAAAPHQQISRRAAVHSTQCSGYCDASVRLSLRTNHEIDSNNNNVNNILCAPLSTMTAASLLALAITTASLSPQPAFAYEESDYASETVTNVVAKLKTTAGNADGTFNTLEDVAKIITEGKGVGGTLNYDGIKLTEGFVADEDTTIYNPGLTLLTSSEKERLVAAVVQNRKVGLSSERWSENNEYAFDFLKQKLDPLHMNEIEGYLGIVPFYGAALYLGALYVQKYARGIFPLVYGLCALGVFGPVFLLVSLGP